MDIRSIRSSLTAVGCAGVLLMGGCATPAPPPAGAAAAEPAVRTSDPPASMTGPPIRPPIPLDTDGVTATVADLERHLATLTPVEAVTCTGTEGALRQWDTLLCSPDEVTTNPYRVIVLADDGNYGFFGGPEYTANEYHAHPPGITDCADLRTVPAGVPARAGMSYPALLYYWLQEGRPAALLREDALPCVEDSELPFLARLLASPLNPVASVAGRETPVTIARIRDHAESVWSGRIVSQVWSDCRVGGTGISVDSPARSGATLVCDRQEEVSSRTGEAYVVVIDDDGSYLITDGGWMTARPTSYDESATCAMVAAGLLPSGYRQPRLDYTEVLFLWFSLGRPADWDVDGDGRPCEGRYPAADIDATLASVIQP